MITHHPGRVAVSLCAAFIALIAHSPPASGDNWAGASGIYGLCSDGINRTDSATMSFHYQDLSAHMTSRVNWVRTERIHPTDLHTSIHAAATSSTDVIVLDQYYDDYCGLNWDRGVWGLYNCRSIRSDRSCEQAHVRFNNTFTTGFTANQRNSLVCHEVGHAIGLIHREATGCIRVGNLSHSGYSTHDRAHINNAF